MGASTDGSATTGDGPSGSTDAAPSGEPTPVVDAGASCTQDRTSAAGKFTTADEAIWEASTGAVEVIVTVKGGATVTPLPTCPDRATPCPAANAVTSAWSAENLESQKCVRQLIVDIGGTPHAEVFWLVNDFVADLTWAQIQIVATDPDVESIAPNVVTMGDGGP